MAGLLSTSQMTSLQKILPAGILAVIGILICLLRQQPSQSSVRTPSGIASTLQVPPGASSESPSAAFQSAASLSSSDVSADIMSAIHSNLRKWLDAKKHGSGDKVEEAMDALEGLLTDQNAAVIIQSLSPDELQTRFGMAAIGHWMNANPVQASNWIAARPDATPDETWAVAKGWTSDGAGLRTYLGQLPDTPWKQNLIQQAGSLISATDPPTAIALAQRITPGPAQTTLLRSVATNWVATDPNATLTWINGLSDPSLREQLIATAAQSYALTDPAQAAAWLASSVRSDGIAKAAALNIAQTWVTRDPAAAAGWVSQFPDGDTRTAAVNIVSAYWQQTNPDAASAWIQNLSREK
jgi:hypothetical protein